MVEPCDRLARVIHEGKPLCLCHAPTEYQTEEVKAKRRTFATIAYYDFAVGAMEGDPVAIEKLKQHREKCRLTMRRKAEQKRIANIASLVAARTETPTDSHEDIIGSLGFGL